MHEADVVGVLGVVAAEVEEVEEGDGRLGRLPLARLYLGTAVSGEAREDAVVVGGAVGAEPQPAAPPVVGEVVHDGAWLDLEISQADGGDGAEPD